MKKNSRKEGWRSGIHLAHVESLPIALTKEMCNGKSDEYFVKLNFCRDPTSSTLDLYEFKMSLFDHGEPEEFLLLTLVVTGMQEMDSKLWYICALGRGQALHQFDLLSPDVENIQTLNADYYIKGLALYFSL